MNSVFDKPISRSTSSPCFLSAGSMRACKRAVFAMLVTDIGFVDWGIDHNVIRLYYNCNIPDSDRFVSIDHNSAQYKEVMEKYSELEKVIEQNNEIGALDPEHREQIIAELDASRRLLQAVRVRVDAFKSVSITGLKWLAEKFMGNVVGILASELMKLLAKLIVSLSAIWFSEWLCFPL